MNKLNYGIIRPVISNPSRITISRLWIFLSLAIYSLQSCTSPSLETINDQGEQVINNELTAGAVLPTSNAKAINDDVSEQLTPSPITTAIQAEMINDPTPTIDSQGSIQTITIISPENTKEIPTPTPNLLNSFLANNFEISEDSTFAVFASTNLLWAPQYSEFVKIEDRIILSNQPWAPEGVRMASIIKADKRSEEDQLGLLSLKDSSIKYLPNTIPFGTDPQNTKFSSPPLWSPNGKYLLYSILDQNEKEKSKIIIYDLDTQMIVYQSEEIPLVNLSGWSFDSTQIAYVWWNDETLELDKNTTLSIIDIEQDFSENQVVFEFNQIGEVASWSPNENKLLIYTSQIDRLTYRSFFTYGYHQIFVFDLQVGEFTLVKDQSIRPHHFGGESPSSYFISANPWSPNGQEILYSDRGIICKYSFSDSNEVCFNNIDLEIQNLGALGAEYPNWVPSSSSISFNVRMAQGYCNPIVLFDLDFNSFRLGDQENGECSVFGASWIQIDLN